MPPINNLPKRYVGTAISVGAALGVLCYSFFNHGESSRYNELAIWLVIGCVAGALFEWFWSRLLRSIHEAKRQS